MRYGSTLWQDLPTSPGMKTAGHPMPVHDSDQQKLPEWQSSELLQVCFKSLKNCCRAAIVGSLADGSLISILPILALRNASLHVFPFVTLIIVLATRQATDTALLARQFHTRMDLTLILYGQTHLKMQEDLRAWLKVCVLSV